MSIARNTDPDSSHQAAREIIEDGTRETMQRIAVECVRKSPGLTARELQKKYPEVRGEIWKRLVEVERQGYITREYSEPCSVTGKKALRCYPVIKAAA